MGAIFFALSASSWLPAQDSAKQTKLKTDKTHKANRLAEETSPYLLLHAHNPVDWYPWGEEALAKARQENKLIFLSIGYSSCYWCHVMERESFMDEEIAAFMNEHFVCIKVDREERPDVDEIYMTALSLTGRRGGWPLSMFLTPEAKPVFGGTYFPPRDKTIESPAGEDKDQEPRKVAVTGFFTILKLVDEAWRDQRDQMLESADQLTDALRRAMRNRPIQPAIPVDEALIDEVQLALVEEFDSAHGGFGYSANNDHVPKFPVPSNLRFLIERGRRNNSKALAMVHTTLDKMSAGGIHDQVGGGFHRYSTDRFWRVPHFEKMLYDNAQLASVFVEAYRLNQSQDYRQVVVDLLAFVEREMTAPQGGFYSALDAETEHEEGAFYIWKREDIEAALSQDELQAVVQICQLDEPPNFEGRFVLTKEKSPKEVAIALGVSEEAIAARWNSARQKLLAARDTRERPATDTKILTSWNGLMIRGYADAGRYFREPRYIQAAAKAANFVLENMQNDQGRLYRTYGKGAAKLNGYLDDYAFFIDGLIALHQATGEKRWLDEAARLMDLQLKHFQDDEAGGFFYTSDDHEVLIARGKDPVDSVLPSGNSMSVENLVFLAQVLERQEYREAAEQTMSALSGFMRQSPGSMPRMAMAWLHYVDAAATTNPPANGNK